MLDPKTYHIRMKEILVALSQWGYWQGPVEVMDKASYESVFVTPNIISRKS
jgi:hypothetical protein